MLVFVYAGVVVLFDFVFGRVVPLPSSSPTLASESKGEDKLLPSLFFYLVRVSAGVVSVVFSSLSLSLTTLKETGL